MTITFLDLETTGLKQEEGDQIVEIAIMHFTEQGKIVDSYAQRIKPTKAIGADAQRVHGISMADLVSSPSWESVAGAVHKQLDMADLLVAHNMDFDGPFIAGELARVGLSCNKPTYCTMQNGRWACFDGKIPSLKELCFSLGVEYDTSKAHAALYDVEVTAKCFFKGVERGFYLV